VTLNWKKTTLSGKEQTALKIRPNGFLGGGSYRFHSVERRAHDMVAKYPA